MALHANHLMQCILAQEDSLGTASQRHIQTCVKHVFNTTRPVMHIYNVCATTNQCVA